MQLNPRQKETILGWQHNFHQYPEVSCEEYQTAAKISRILSDLGIESQSIGKTGVVAEIRGTQPGSEPKTLLLRADVDALPMNEINEFPWKSKNPGAAHACGHDGHISALLGAAMFLSENPQSFSGTVRLVFQPAEETIGGALELISQGILNGVDRAAGLHFWPALESGKIACEYLSPMAGCQHVTIRFFGNGGHISVPHTAHNPLLSAAQAFVQLQTLIPQQFSPFDELLIGFGKLNGGTQYNIIPEEATLDGTIRAFDSRTLEEIRAAVQNTAEHIAAANRNTCQTSFTDSIPPVENDRQAVDTAIQAATRVVGPDHVLTTLLRQFTGDDFANYSVEVPSVYVKIGSCNPAKPETGNALHHPGFTLDEQALYIATEYFANYALIYLNQ